jgi:signal transduction histidine kinase
LGDALDSYTTFLARADERIDGLSELISDLLSLSRIEHEGAVPTPPAPLDITPIINETVEQWKNRVGGQLQISSTPGIGSEFRVVFPC